MSDFQVSGSITSQRLAGVDSPGSGLVFGGKGGGDQSRKVPGSGSGGGTSSRAPSAVGGFRSGGGADCSLGGVGRQSEDGVSVIGFGEDELYRGNGRAAAGRPSDSTQQFNAVKRYGNVMPSDLALVEQLRQGGQGVGQNNLMGSGPKQFL